MNDDTEELEMLISTYNTLKQQLEIVQASIGRVQTELDSLLEEIEAERGKYQ